MTFRAILFISLLLASSSGVFGQTIQLPEGDFRDVSPEDFVARNHPSKFYSEFYTYQIQLTNGVQILYTFSISDVGSFRQRVTAAKMAVRWIDGQDYIVNKEYPIEKFINKADSAVIRLHPERSYWAKGRLDREHTLSFKTTKNGVAYDIRLRIYDMATGKIWGDGTYLLNGDKFGLSILIPHGKVKGYVSINGERIEAEGTAMMDHIYQTNLPTRLIGKSFRIKSGDSYNGYVFNFFTTGDGQETTPFGYGIRYEQGKAKKITPKAFRFTESKKTHGVDLESHFVIRTDDSDEIEVIVTEHYNSYSILDEIGGLKKFIARKILRGEVVEMNGIATVNGAPGFFSFTSVK